MSDKIVDIARRRAEEVVLGNVDPRVGLLGGQQAYHQVWARDAAICTLGLALSKEGVAVARRSLETLRRFQSPLGNIPHNVGFPSGTDQALLAFGTAKRDRPKDAAGGKAGDGQVNGEPEADTAHAGCIDSALWFIVAQWYLHRVQRDPGHLREAWPSMQRALLWLRYQDSNECGLLEAHEATDWADLFAHRYNTLNANVLYAAALRGMAELATTLGEDGAHYDCMAEDVKFKINLLLWVGPREGDGRQQELAWAMAKRKEWLYPMRLMDVVLAERPYYLPYVAFRDYGERCDTLGNLLAVLFDVALPERAEKALGHIWSAGMDRPFPVRAVHPPVRPGDREWRDYYRLRNLNHPYQYHNGGVWPFIGGFYVAALVKMRRYCEAEQQLAALAEANRQGRHGEWEFNEWLHGQSGRPMGFPQQSWSAAMYIYAYECVKAGRAIGL